MSRVLGVILLVLSLAFVASFVAIARVNRLGGEIAEMTEEGLPLSRNLSAIAVYQLERDELLEELVLGAGAEAATRAKAEFSRLTGQIAENLEAVRAQALALATEVEGAEGGDAVALVTEPLDRVARLLEDYRRTGEEVLRLAADGKAEEAAALLAPSASGTRAELLVQLEALWTWTGRTAAERVRAARQSESGTLTTVLALLAVAAAAASMLGIVVVRRLARGVAGWGTLLRVQESRLAAVLGATADAIVAIDERGIIKLFNRSAERVFGYRAQEVVGRNVSVLMPTPYRFEHDGYLERYGRTGEARIIGQERELEGQRKDGTRFPITLRVAEAKGAGERLFIGTIQDITRRKEAEETLRRSEERYRTLFEESRDAIIICTLRGELVDGNPAWWELVGYERGDLVDALNVTTMFADPGDHERLVSLIERERAVRDFEVALLTRDGTERDCLLTASGRASPTGRLWGYQAIVRDVTEQRRLESQLIRSQRLEAVGQLAGGIAHDFNNVLMAIMGSSELIRGDLDPDHRARADLDVIDQATRRGADLIRQLLAFSRRQVMMPRVVNLNSVVEDMEKMLRRVLREDIELETVLDPDLAPVKADPGQLQQVIVNLATNARDAMPHGGRLTIETANVELDESYARTHVSVQPGPYVRLSVSDTGVGMSEETQARIFEPFFTTKEDGEGTGLGLATVYGIVKQSDGHIWVYSEPKRGTKFNVYLPRVEGEVESPAENPSSTAVPGGTETLLVVEDEVSLRTLICERLRVQGYTVLEAGDGLEALEVNEHHSGTIDLLVTDVVMPRMRGPELAKNLVGSRPALKVIYMSGYPDPSITGDWTARSGMAYMEKPFTLDSLLRKVREVLDQASN
jgi:PAS domain S-box-containing protein